MTPQSALVTAGRDAEQIAHLFTVMAVGTLIVWAAVVAIAVYAIRVRGEHSERGANLLIIGGGVALPTVVLAALLLSFWVRQPPENGHGSGPPHAPRA